MSQDGNGFGMLAVSALAVLCLMVMIMPAVMGGRRDSSSGRVRILYIGDGWGPSPVPKFQSDPAFTVISVATSELHVGQGVMAFDDLTMRKFVRLYMPRTYRDMVDNYDLVILSDANIVFMGQNHLQWIRQSLTDEGLGLVMVGGLESFGAPRGEPWTPLEDLLPVKFIMGGWYYPSFKVTPARDHAFTRSLPWDSIPLFHGTNRVSLRDAATLLLTAKGIPYPPLSYWDVGRGRSVAHAMDWTPGGATDVMRWEYYGDYVANVAYLATRNEIPENAQLLHLLRTSFWSARSRISLVIDTMNFAERFGANINRIERQLGDVRAMISGAEDSYVRQEYDRARKRIDEIDDRITQLQADAMRLKDVALLWVYLIEWMATTATALLSGFVLWTLMVRRRLYREANVTRLVSPER